MPEWPIGAPWKGDGRRRHKGSNPFLTAKCCPAGQIGKVGSLKRSSCSEFESRVGHHKYLMLVKDIITEAAVGLNKLHDPVEYEKAYQGFDLLYDTEAKVMLDRYSAAVDEIISKGGTVYRAVWAKSAKAVNLKNPGLHWTVFPEAAEEYLDSEHGWAEYDAVNAPHGFLISAEVGPQNISNRNVILSKFPEEAEVNIINPRQAKFKIVKQLNIS